MRLVLVSFATSLPGGRRSPAARGIALLAALALPLASGASLYHQATVTHHTCTEHGETIHLPELERAEEPARSRPQQGLASLYGVDPLEGGDPDHEHCELSYSSRERVALTGDATFARVPALGTAQGATLDQDRPARVAVYAVAPKTSPPA